MRDAQVRQADELRLVRDDPGPQVLLLAGLPASFAVGLAATLRARGSRCRTLPALGALHEMLDDGPTVLLLRGGGGEVHPQASGRSGPVRLVHVLERLTVQACVDAVRSGATGVVALDADVESSAVAVLAAGAGQTVLPHDVVTALTRPDRGLRSGVSAQEVRLLRRLADGWTVAQLAPREGVSVSELYRLLGDVYRRLGATDRTQALLEAARWGLLDDDRADDPG